ncbi:MAG: hypothetical protein KW804_02385 [Candidatus Doudnabacteria bacterium]|nr:hypothetical protein [Candidatus Doudnabacteria bacterium]
MIDTERENGIEEQYANWHPESEQKEKNEFDSEFEFSANAVLDSVRESEEESSPEAGKRNIARRFFERNFPIVQEKLKEISLLMAQGKSEEAKAVGQNLVSELKTESMNFLTRESGYFKEPEESFKQATAEPETSKKEKLYKLGMDAVDFVPVVGSAKMIAEGLAGKTMGGEELSGTKRLIHTAEGAVFLALDLTGVGVVATEGMKAGRVITRTAALMRKTGMTREIYAPVFKAGRYLIENPGAAKIADKVFERILKARKNHKNTLIEQGKEIIFNNVIEEEEEELTPAV